LESAAPAARQKKPAARARRNSSPDPSFRRALASADEFFDRA